MAPNEKPDIVEKVHCNNCRRSTNHKVIAAVEEADSAAFEDGDVVRWTTGFEMLQCLGCCDVVLRRTFNPSPDDSDTKPVIRYFPPHASRHVPKWYFYLPKDLVPLLFEVYRSLDAGSERLPLMGTRTLVDMVINDKVGDVGSFREKLQTLEKKGYISATGREVLETALDAGSAAAHRGHAASAEDLEAVMDIVENLLQAVYVLPARAKRLKGSTPPRK